MSPMSPVSLVSRSALVGRAAQVAAVSLTLILAAATDVSAQAPAPRSAWELRIPGGALVPTGEQRGAIKKAQLSAVQLSWLVLPRLAATGTFSWARSRDLSSSGAPKLDVFMSDVGVEMRSVEWSPEGPVTLSAFAGLGAGARTYNHRSLDVDATHNIAGYGAVGGELGAGRFALRLEVRDYASGFRPLVAAGPSDARNDVVIMAALRFNRQRRARD